MMRVSSFMKFGKDL